MKNYIYILCFLLSINSFSQVEVRCGTTISPEQIEAYKKLNSPLASNNVSAKTTTVNAANNLKVFKLRIHFVRRSNGTTGYSYTEVDIANSIQRLNNLFETFNVSFEYCGDSDFINFINNDSYYDEIETLSGEEFITGGILGRDKTEILMTDEYKRNDAINLFFVPKIKDGNFVDPAPEVNPGGYTYIPSYITNEKNNYILFDYNVLSEPGDKTLIHEFGHFFGLLHTFNLIPETAGTFLSEYSLIENFERYENDLCFNCSEAGDQLCDTPPDFYHNYIINKDGKITKGDPDTPGTTFHAETCTYTNNIPDQCGNLDTTTHYPATNYMSYYPCANSFTPDQIDVIQTSATDYSSNRYFRLTCCESEIEIVDEENAGIFNFQSVSSTIKANNTIQKGAVVIYDAGDEVLLTDGFVAELGSYFDGYIEGCEGEWSTSRVNKSIFVSETSELSETIELAANETTDANLLVYPNPTNGLFTIESNKLVTSYSINDIIGQQVIFEEAVSLNTLNVDISNFTNGVYFLELQTENGEIITKKVIKK